MRIAARERCSHAGWRLAQTDDVFHASFGMLYMIRDRCEVGRRVVTKAIPREC